MQTPYQLRFERRPHAQIGVGGFVNALPPSARERLLTGGQLKQFKRGQTIQSQGQASRELWLVKAGEVQIGRHSVDGKFHVFTTLTAGQSFGEQAFLGEFPKLVDAVAGSDATLVRIGEAELGQLLSEDGEIARLLLKAMARIVQDMLMALEESRTLTTVQRAAQILLGLCLKHEGHAKIVRTQSDLANAIGVSRVSIGKALNNLEEMGLIVRGYGIVDIVDIARLRAWLAHGVAS